MKPRTKYLIALVTIAVVVTIGFMWVQLLSRPTETHTARISDPEPENTPDSRSQTHKTISSTKGEMEVQLKKVLAEDAAKRSDSAEQVIFSKLRQKYEKEAEDNEAAMREMKKYLAIQHTEYEAAATKATELKRRLTVIDAAVLGSATLQAPTRVHKGEPFEVTLLVQPGELQPLLTITKAEVESKKAATTLEGINEKSRTNVKVVAAEAILVPRMTATLTGIGFNVLPAGELEQPILTKTPTRWVWQVASTEEGIRTLSVRLSGHIKVEENDIQRNFYNYTQNIEVSVGVLGFLQQYWQWITSTLFLPFIAWAWTHYRSKNTHPTPEGRRSFFKKLQKRNSGNV